MSAIPAYGVLIGTGVILTYLPKVLSGAMESIGGAAGFKRAAMAVAGAAITGGTSLGANLAARGAGSMAAGAAGRAAAAGNMTRAARLTRVASLSNKVAEKTSTVGHSSMRQLSNTFKDEAGLGGLTPLPGDDIRFGKGRGGTVGEAPGAATSYKHTGPRGVEEGHLHHEVHGHGTRAEERAAARDERLAPMADTAARRYVKAYRARSLDLQDRANLENKPLRIDPRTPVASPLRWKEGTDKDNPTKRVSYYDSARPNGDPPGGTGSKKA